MKIGSLLAQAEQCKSEKDADDLLKLMQKVFGSQPLLARLSQNNDEAYMEDGKPFVRLEFNREISNHYITMIRPEIRGGEFVVVVVTYHMLDGHGMQSQNWEVAEGLDETVLEPDADQSVEEVVRQAVDCAIAEHQELIERVGVPVDAARTAAEQSW